MPLQRGEVRGYDFNRMVLEFTMLNESKVILCAVSTAAMDGLEGSRNVTPDQRAVSLPGCVTSLRREHRASSSKNRAAPIDPSYCARSISSSRAFPKFESRHHPSASP
jgi:hypothetical protein